MIEDIYAVEKPKQNNINNPQGAINKGGRRGERRKSGRELALKVETKQTRIAVEQAAKDTVAAEQPTRTNLVEEPTNAS
ncbi:hypothetical protein Tco_1040836 [Tanacetum coccineum]|uniref:Uncharacterized protein n=1 Tax=Tanacetum coccineum TaxID=301880 RepID=A0ABQ5GFX9_9ASTR